jgi:hypothetical protein
VEADAASAALYGSEQTRSGYSNSRCIPRPWKPLFISHVIWIRRIASWQVVRWQAEACQSNTSRFLVERPAFKQRAVLSPCLSQLVPCPVVASTAPRHLINVGPVSTCDRALANSMQ